MITLRKIFFAFLCLSFSFFQSCDPCASIICNHGGTCVNGSCICTAGYEGTDCSIESRNKFLGTYEVRYSMKGRTITNKPRVDIMTEEHGTVVVDVTIDKYGHVISAVPGGKGTTTDSKYLMTKAKQCAETALYDTKPTYPLKTQGTFSITF